MSTIAPLATPLTYNGWERFPVDRPVAYEGSPMAKVTGDAQQYISELGKAQTKTQNALATLRQIADEPVMATRRESSFRLVTAVDQARRAISPYMNHVPGSEGFENNEVPRYLQDGSIHPDDVGNRKLNFDGSVQMHQETVLYRLDKQHLDRVNVAPVKESLETSTRFDDLLIWGNKVTVDGTPDIPRAIHELELLDTQFANLLGNAGGPAVKTPSVAHRAKGLPMPVMITLGGVAALGIAGGIYMAAREK